MHYCYNEQQLTLTEISRRSGIKLGTLRRRVLTLGLTIPQALELGVRAQYRVRANGTKRCAQCGGVFDVSLFKKHVRGKRRYSGYCRTCDNIRNKDYARVQRMALLRHYGGTPPKCAICGEARVAVLDIHHLEGNGTQHRKQLGHNRLFYRALIRDKFPAGYGVLCRNCNWIEHLKAHHIGEYAKEDLS